MKRSTIVIFAGLTMVVGIASFAAEATAPDGSVLSDVRTAVADDGTTWVRVGLGAPIAITPSAEGALQLPGLAQAAWLVQDGLSGEPVTDGSLSWKIAGAPDELTEVSWHAENGFLDLPCRGGERVLVSAPGYAPIPTRVAADGRRHTVLLQPRAAAT